MRSTVDLRPITLEKKDFELRVGEKGHNTSEILRIFLGPYVQYCPCEASEQKPEQYGLKDIELSYFLDFGLKFFLEA